MIFAKKTNSKGSKLTEICFSRIDQPSDYYPYKHLMSYGPDFFPYEYLFYGTLKVCVKFGCPRVCILGAILILGDPRYNSPPPCLIVVRISHA